MQAPTSDSNVIRLKKKFCQSIEKVNKEKACSPNQEEKVGLGRRYLCSGRARDFGVSRDSCRVHNINLAHRQIQRMIASLVGRKASHELRVNSKPAEKSTSTSGGV